MDPSNYRTIPDLVLEDATCGLCLKYLTVAPIGVSAEGTNTCGRCSKSGLPTLFEYNGERLEELIPLTFLGYATSPNYLFPCINRYEGCRTALPYLYMKQHEEDCFCEDRVCFLCDFCGAGTQLVEHFKQNHRKNLLSSNSPLFIKVNEMFENRYLYRTFKSLFTVSVHFIEDLKLCMIQIRYLGSAKIPKTRVKCSVEINGTRNDNLSTILSTRLFSTSGKDVNMNFRMDDNKIIDFEDFSLRFIIFEA